MTKKNKTISSCILLSTIMLLVLILCSSFSYAKDGKSTEYDGTSISGEYFNKVFSIVITDGDDLITNQTDSLEREKINDAIYNGTANKTYSLYDRFGGDITFMPYFGEYQIQTTILDRILQAYQKNEENIGLNYDMLKELFAGSAISNNSVYDNRPIVLSKDHVKYGFEDPRVYATEVAWKTGGDAAIGNTGLTFSKFMVNITSFFTGSKVFDKIDNFIQKVVKIGGENGPFNLIVKTTIYLLPLFLCFSVYFIVRDVMKYKNGKSGGLIFKNIFSILLSCVVISVFLANPFALNKLIRTTIGVFDDVIDTSLSVTGSDVVKSDSVENARTAALWETAVFDPWCNGMFQKSYKDLYTTYDKGEHGGMLPQSNDEIGTKNGPKHKRNSAKLTGDINVPLGGGVQVKNWAALAWSCQSLYHIDAVKVDKTEEKSKDGEAAKEQNKQNDQKQDDKNKSAIDLKATWPRSTRTLYNNDINVDNFRWIDAKMNISPLYTGDSTEGYPSYNISKSNRDANAYEQTFAAQGKESAFRGLLLLPLLIVGLKKFIKAFQLVVNSATIIGKSLGSMINPEKFALTDAFQKLFYNVKFFIWYSILIFIMIEMYKLLVPKGVIACLIWILISFYMIKNVPEFKLRNIKYKIRTTKAKIRNFGKTSF